MDNGAADEFASLDATAQAQLVKSGDVTPLELVDAAIARIESINPLLNAVIHKSYDKARARAQSEALPHGPFRGVPYLIKDLAEQKGEPWSLGSNLMTNHRPRYDHGSVERAKKAGLIILGKTNTPELGLMPTTESARFGACKNPWNLDYHTGGSSGGAAAAVASGMVPFAHGSDGGGSIRIPASVCGLFGLKPSRHRLYEGRQRPVAGDIAVRFCLSRSVRDSARLLSVAEIQKNGRYAPTGFVSGPNKKRLKIGFTTLSHYRGQDGDDDVKAAIQKSAKLCESLGHRVEESPAPPFDTEEFAAHFFTVWTSVSVELVEKAFYIGLLQGRLRRSNTHLERWTRELAQRFRSVEKSDPTRLARAVKYFDDLEVHFREMHQNFDVLLSPVLRTGPLRLGEMSHETPLDELFAQMTDYAPYTSPHNAAGVPAMSVPLGFSSEGMPIGSHFSAGPGKERTLLELAYELEAAAPWANQWPGISAPMRRAS